MELGTGQQQESLWASPWHHLGSVACDSRKWSWCSHTGIRKGPSHTGLQMTKCQLQPSDRLWSPSVTSSFRLLFFYIHIWHQQKNKLKRALRQSVFHALVPMFHISWTSGKQFIELISLQCLSSLFLVFNLLYAVLRTKPYYLLIFFLHSLTNIIFFFSRRLLHLDIKPTYSPLLFFFSGEQYKQHRFICFSKTFNIRLYFFLFFSF